MIDIASRGSFAAAARAHGLDPSKVSRRAAEIEAALRVRIFERTTRRLALTEAGAAYLARAEEALALLDAAAEDAQSARRRPRGTLRITASVAYAQRVLQPLLHDLLRDYPEMSVELRATDAVVDMVAEGVDLGVRLGPEARGDVIATRLRPTRYAVCASPAYLASSPRLAQPEDLARHECVRFTLPEFRARWRFRRPASSPFEVEISGRFSASTAMGVRDAAMAGLGPALLADWLVAADLESGALIDLFPDHEATATSFDTAAWLVYPSRRFLPAKTRAAIDFLRARLGRGAP